MDLVEKWARDVQSIEVPDQEESLRQLEAWRIDCEHVDPVGNRAGKGKARATQKPTRGGMNNVSHTKIAAHGTLQNFEVISRSQIYSNLYVKYNII